MLINWQDYGRREGFVTFICLFEEYTNKLDNGSLIIPFENLPKYNLPEEIINEMSKWKIIKKSPYSNSFYDSEDISWDYKPHGSKRVSDHWNFKTSKSHRIHCVTDKPVKDKSYVSVGIWDGKKGEYQIILSVPSLKHQKYVNYYSNNEYHKKMLDFKNRIKNREIYIVLTTKSQKIKGILRKYTGQELKIENEKGELIFNDNYARDRGYDIVLMDSNGVELVNPYLIP
jgi:hypothetical protein